MCVWCDLDQRAPLGALRQLVGPGMVPLPAGCLGLPPPAWQPPQPGKQKPSSEAIRDSRFQTGFRHAAHARKDLEYGLLNPTSQPVEDTLLGFHPQHLQIRGGIGRTHHGNSQSTECSGRTRWDSCGPASHRDPDILTVTSARTRHPATASRNKGLIVPRVVERVSAGGFCPSSTPHWG